MLHGLGFQILKNPFKCRIHGNENDFLCTYQGPQICSELVTPLLGILPVRYLFRVKKVSTSVDSELSYQAGYRHAPCNPNPFMIGLKFTAVIMKLALIC